ncbi:MAG: hypothetical protein IKU52_05325 [Clostridia bacterium]|nr:hypothetical protein [Clostridia bacterium]
MILLTGCAGNSGTQKETEIQKITDSEEKETGSIKETQPQTEKETVLIYDAIGLNGIRNDLCGSYRLANDIVFESADFEEGGAFYNNGKGWQAIGGEEDPFTGNFDGAGFSVKNLYVNIDETLEEGASIYASLFGKNEGSVENVSVSDCRISARYNGKSARIGVYSAAIVSNNSGTVSNCNASGEIYAEALSSNEKVFAFAGGICGTNFGKVLSCRNDSHVSAVLKMTVEKAQALESETSNSPYYGFCYAGGIAGQACGDVNNSLNTGNVKANSGADNPIGFVFDEVLAGGITGEAHYAAISNCTNEGNIEASSDGTVNYIDGIAGRNTASEIIDCLNDGELYY